MSIYKQIGFALRYSKLTFYFLLIVVGVFVQGEHEAAGQTVPGTGGILIRKIVQTTGSDSTQFTFTANSALGSVQFSLGNNGEKAFYNLTPGANYNVSEAVRSNWVLASATCDDPQSDPRTQIVVTAGKIVTCTFVNQRKGRLIIQKVTEPAADTATNFPFTAGGGLSPTQFSLKNNGSRTYSNLVPGSGYTISETPPAGWAQRSATCDNGSPVTNITINPGQTVTCTFINAKLGTLLIRKVTSPNPDLTQQAFPFTASGGLAPTTFSLKNGETQTFSNLLPGDSYSVSEQPTANWNLTKTACSDNSPITNIAIDPGETVTCTFTNKNDTVGLTLTKTDNDAVAQPGALLAYTLAYANQGLLPELGVVLKEQVPAHTVFVGPEGWSCSPNQEAGAACTYPVGTVATGSSGAVDFVVRVNPTAPAGSHEITNQATIGTLLLPEVDTDSEKTPLNAAPDLLLNKNASSSSIAPGGVLLYTLTYRNQGNQDATGVVITETVPDHTTFTASGSTVGWNCSGDICRFTIGALAVGAEGNITFALQMNSGVPADVTEIVNNGAITDDGGNGADPTPANNLATTTTTINRTFSVIATKRDQLLVDADGDSVPSPGDTLEYEVTVRNNSTVGIRAVVFNDTPDSNTTLLPSVQSSLGTVTLGNGATDTRVTVALGDMAGNGATATIRFRVQIKQGLAPTVVDLQNQGVISSPDFSDIPTDDPDSNAGNDATHTPLRAFAQIKATLTDYLFVDSDGNDVVSIGDILIYRLLVSNTGNRAAGGLQILDLPNLGLMLVPGSVSTSDGTVVLGNGANDATVRIEIPLLAVGAQVVASYQMQVVAGAENVLQNQASISVQSGVEGAAHVTDDPDISGENDVTLTPLGESVAKLTSFFLPLIGKR